MTLFRTLGWLPIDVRIHRVYFTAVAMFTVMNGQAPVYLVNMSTQTNSVHDQNNCGGTNISVKNITCLSGQRRFAYGGTKVWDNIPEIIKTMQPLHVRKDMYECEHFKIDRPA